MTRRPDIVLWHQVCSSSPLALGGGGEFLSCDASSIFGLSRLLGSSIYGLPFDTNESSLVLHTAPARLHQQLKRGSSHHKVSCRRNDTVADWLHLSEVVHKHRQTDKYFYDQLLNYLTSLAVLLTELWNLGFKVLVIVSLGQEGVSIVLFCFKGSFL